MRLITYPFRDNAALDICIDLYWKRSLFCLVPPKTTNQLLCERVHHLKVAFDSSGVSFSC